MRGQRWLINDAIMLTHTQVPTFEEGFLQDKVVYVESAGESGVIIRKADIAGLLQ